jgi:serine/threonine-protein kinase
VVASSSVVAIHPETVVAGKYSITRLIKTGGMGEVYEARHLRLGRRVAIKYLRAQLSQDAAYQARFEREACAAGALEHENVAAIIDFGKDERGTPFIVMEYLDGETLRRLIEERAPLPVPRAIAIVQQICAGLTAAHARGIIHRDLKPENLMVCRHADGRDWVKVLDFGIARMMDQSQTEVTATGVILGTSHYMSPEQARGEEIDVRSDVFAVAAILYELLSGRKAHPGDSYNAVIYQVLSKPLVPLATLRSGLPPALVAVTHRALAREVADRYASITEFAKAIEPFAASAGQGAAAVATLDTTGSIVRAAGLPKRMSSRWGWALAGLALLGAGLLVSLLRTTPEEEPVAQALPQPPPAEHRSAVPQSPEQVAATVQAAPVVRPVPAELPAVASVATAAPSTTSAAPVRPLAKRKLPANGAHGQAGASSAPVPEGFVDSPYGQ